MAQGKPPRSDEPAELELELDSSADAQLRVVLATVSEGVLITNRARIIVAANRVVEELWGYPERKLVGRPLQLLLSMEAREGLLAVWRDVEHGLAHERMRLEAYHADGSTFPVEVGITQATIAGESRYTVAVRDLRRQRQIEERLRQLESAIERVPLGIALADLDGRLGYVNPATARLFGFPADELLGRDLRTLYPEELWSRIEYRHLAAEPSWRREVEARRKDGSTFPAELRPELIDGPSGRASGILTVCVDLSESRQTQAALAASEERYALAVRGANDGLWDWDLVRDEIYLSPRWRTLVGLPAIEATVTPKAWLGRIHPEDRPRLEANLADHLGGLSEHFASEHRMLHEDGSYRWMLARARAVWDDAGRPTRIAGSLTDVNERKLHDPQTGLPNRTLFLDRLAAEIERQRRLSGRGLAVLALDLDRFKRVNESLGLAAGDELLLLISRRLQTVLRPFDTLARLGGDELAVLLVDVSSAEETRARAEELAAAIARPAEIARHEIVVTASIGIALCPASPASTEAARAEDLLRDAELATYHAKDRGRARCEVFDPSLRARAVARLWLEANLRHALERDELELMYQPVMTLEKPSVRGFEALLRWRHPDAGDLLPATFLPLAEEAGLMPQIGTWVLRQACWQAKAWQRRADRELEFTIGVNLSAAQVASPDLAAEVRAALADSGLAPRCLRLEIAESTVASQFELALSAIEQLRRLGVEVALDHFGAGPSSLSMLHLIPVDALKLDRSLLHALETEPKKSDLLRAVLRMAEDLGIRAIAEGVESAGQMEALRALGCELVQGYFLSGPLETQAAFEALGSGTSVRRWPSRRRANRL